MLSPSHWLHKIPISKSHHFQPKIWKLLVTNKIALSMARTLKFSPKFQFFPPKNFNPIKTLWNSICKIMTNFKWLHDIYVVPTSFSHFGIALIKC
jgi:hypothetical protein